MLNRPDLPADHPANTIDPRLLQRGADKFAAKLTFDERCQMLALRLANMSIGAIAITFQVNRRTVTKLYTPNSGRYENVRQMAKAMGDDAFMKKYLTPELMERARAASLLPEASETYAESDKTPGAAKLGHPNKGANRHSGVSMVKGLRVETTWITGQDDYAEGWYTRILDNPDYGDWFGNPDENTHLTSLSALNYAKLVIDENEMALTP